MSSIKYENKQGGEIRIHWYTLNWCKLKAFVI